ncbi:hypothetical protein [Vulcanisaeta sp. JCM 16159]|uniref:hypothetical protein n=1 Tax=Vulcanisaeta sp. JCM 16159 TaxID=1295371 RepID=UPI0006D1F41F|nr:hypothetical protein [Vulcanisaeta sp. JCM 16159]
MSNLNKRVYELHGRVMSEFMGGKCYDIDEPSVISCIKDALASIGLSVKDLIFFDIDGNIVKDLGSARYVRVTATIDDVSGEQIFTFALLKFRNKYRVLYLQSAIKEE